MFKLTVKDEQGTADEDVAILTVAGGLYKFVLLIFGRIKAVCIIYFIYLKESHERELVEVVLGKKLFIYLKHSTIQSIISKNKQPTYQTYAHF